MGIIRSQSIKATILTYIGFAIGAINMVFVMPRFFTKEQYGLLTVFVAFANQVVTIGSVGMATVTNKFLPYYRAHLAPSKRDLLSLALFLGTIGMIVVLGLSYLNIDFIIRKFNKNAGIFVQYMYLFPIFSMGYFYYYVFESFNNNYKFTVWGSFVREIFYKSFNLIAAVLFALGWVTFTGVMNIYMIMYWLGAILLATNLSVHKLLYVPLTISKLTKRIWCSMSKYSLSTWGINILGVTFQFIDTFAIAGLIGIGTAGIYSIAKLIISPVVIPTGSVINISVPLISDAWRRNDLSKIEEIYKKTALALLLICGFVFFLIWTNSYDILSLIPSKFIGSDSIVKEVQNVILILGIARALDFSTSVNSHILQNSRKYYMVDVTTNIVMVILAIPLNYFFIKSYGIIGAALWILISSFSYNAFKAIFLFVKEHIHPFSKKWITTLCTYAALIFLAYLLNKIIFDRFHSSSVIILLLRISVKSIILTSVFIATIYVFKISEDINMTIRSIITKGKEVLHLSGK